MDSKTVNCEEAAKIIGISYWKLLEMCKKGEVPFIAIGKLRLFRVESLEKWLEEKETQSYSRKNENLEYNYSSSLKRR